MFLLIKQHWKSWRTYGNVMFLSTKQHWKIRQEVWNCYVFIDQTTLEDSAGKYKIVMVLWSKQFLSAKQYWEIVCLSVCLSVCLCVCHRSHAKCSKCSTWKNIAAEKWKAHEVDNMKRRGSKLLCGQCRESGITKRSMALFPCVGCSQRAGDKIELGREHFDKKALSNAKTQGSPLVCRTCQEREASIWEKIRALDGRGACPCTSTWRHKPGCAFLRKTKVRISKTDPEWLLFRKSNRLPNVEEITYYADIGVLDE